MTSSPITKKIYQLSDADRQTVEKFIDFLLSKQKKRVGKKQPTQRAGFGSWQGITLSEDFDAPLEDFKSYME